MRRTPGGRAFVAAGAAFALVAGTISVGAPPAAATVTVRVMQYNICGVLCNDGVVDRPGGGNDIVDDVANRIAKARPGLVFLNEICAGQFHRLKARLGANAWKMSGVFRPQRSDRGCRGGSGFGDAVLTAGHVGRTEVLQLPDLGSENRAVLCLQTSAGGPVLACALHLVTGRGKAGAREKTLQLDAAARALNARAAGRAVIVGGDFNLAPSQMGAFLSSGKGGRFFDVDPQKAATHGKKIDYVLFSRSHFRAPSGGPARSRFSDHHLLVGRAVRG